MCCWGPHFIDREIEVNSPYLGQSSHTVTKDLNPDVPTPELTALVTPEYPNWVQMVTQSRGN